MNFKKDFPIFEEHKDLTYLDSAATSQKPKKVIETLKYFYEKENANVNRGLYKLSEEATRKHNEARKIIAEFVNSNVREIIFTKNTTESINLLAYTLKKVISDDKNEIVLSEMEHHSNLIPWQEFAKRNNMKLKFIPINENYELDYERAKELITNKTAIVSVTHVSNVFGTVNDVKKLIELAKDKGALTIVDAAQSVAHKKIDVKDLDCDFLVFSGHKMFGSNGVGVLYGKDYLLKRLPPFQFGGGMINSVDYENGEWADVPEKFEAGTQDVAGAIGLGEAAKYVEEIGFAEIEKHEKEILEYALEELKKIEEVEIYNPGFDKSVGVVSFNLHGIHGHDVASILDEENIAIRAGHHCCMPLMKKLGISGTCRASFSIYNTKEDVDKLIEGLKKVKEVFK